MDKAPMHPQDEPLAWRFVRLTAYITMTPILALQIAILAGWQQ